MTKAAQHFGKKQSNFWASPGTEEYLVALAQLPEFQGVKLVDPTPGRYGGTWGHPKLAVPFSRWLDVHFVVWCDAMIEDIIKGASRAGHHEARCVGRSIMVHIRKGQPSLVCDS